LKQSFAVVARITHNWRNSRWCFGEWVAASVLGETILPFVDETVKLRAELSKIQHITFSRQRPDFEDLKTDVERYFTQHRAAQDFGEPPFPYAFRYEPEDAVTFRGREKEIDKIVTQLNAMRHSRDGRALLLHGTSFAGKSSLVRAGVYPKIIRMPKLWVAVPLFKTVSEPFDQLLKKLSSSFAGSVNERSLQDILEELRNPSKKDFDDVWQKIAGLLDKKTLVLIIDNLDRYFSQGTGQSERLLMLLGSAIRAQPINVIGVLRSDQLNRVNEALNVSSLHYDTMCVVPAEPQVLISSLKEILLEKRYEIDADLIHTIYVDMGASMAAWPYIGRYLNDLRQAAEHKKTAFKLDNYHRRGGIAAQVKNELGTVEATLGSDLDAFFDFLAFEGVSHGEGDEIVTRPIPRARIRQQYERAIQLLEEKCLFTTGANRTTGEPTTEIVPAVMKYWDRSRIAHRVHANEEVYEAKRAAQYWKLKGRQPEWLVHRGNRLLRVREYAEPRRLDDLLNVYLEECEKHFR
jgi:hypothetical protein